MDKVKKFEKAILSILEEYAKIKYDDLDGANQVLADRQNHRYLVLTMGRYKVGEDSGKSVHDSPMHFDIINNKIWVQRNMTEWNVGEMLEKQGVKKSEIVIGFLSPKMREYSDYALA